MGPPDKNPLSNNRPQTDLEEDNILTQILQQYPKESLERSTEDPVLILIVFHGLTIFFHPFKSGKDLNEQLIGGLVDAIDKFGPEVLRASGGIKQIEYEEYMIAVRPLETLRVGYIFQGPSDLAHPKLDQFLNHIQADPVLHPPLIALTRPAAKQRAVPALNPAVQSGLRQLITDIFQPDEYPIHSDAPLLPQANQLFWLGKFPEALQLLDHLDSQNDLAELEWLQGQLLRCRILAYLDIRKAQDLGDQLIETSQVLEQPLLSVDTCHILAQAWLEHGILKSCSIYLNRGKAILANISGLKTRELAPREATEVVLEGGLQSFQGALTHAFKSLNQGQTLHQQIDNPNGVAQAQYYLGQTHFFKHEWDQALECMQQCHSLRQQLHFPPAIAQALYYLGRIDYNRGERAQGEKFLHQSIVHYHRQGVLHGTALSLAWLSMVYMAKGELNTALEMCHQSLKLSDQLRIPGTFAEAWALRVLGDIHLFFGDLDLGLKYKQKCLALHETSGYLQQIAYLNTDIGYIYWQQGNKEAAFQSLESSWHLFCNLQTEHVACLTLNTLVQVSLDLEKPDLARHYLHQLEVIRNKAPSPFSRLHYQFAQAVLLKASPRTRDKMKAQELFTQLTENKAFFQLTVRASLHLCELLLFEFKSSAAPEILQELHTVTKNLQEYAQSQNAHSVLTETYILQAKLALLELDLNTARQRFTQAQVLAEDKGLLRLAQNISHEHDTLLAQLPQWEALPTQEVSFTETRELARIEEDISRMLQQRAPESPELPPEESTLLLIIAESGLVVYSYPFAKGTPLDEALLGGLFTSINSFGREVFAGSTGIDRIMFQNYTVAVKPLDSLLVCYIFQGQSYLAVQKLNHFIRRFQAIPSVFQFLTTVTRLDTLKVGDALDPSIQIALDQLISSIFSSAHD